MSAEFPSPPLDLAIREDAVVSGGPKPGTPLVVCFPSAGLASTIVGHYLIQKLNLPRIATVRSPLMLSVSVILDGKPNPPIRIYGNEQLAVAVSEFPPSPVLMTYLARVLLDWCSKRGLSPIYAVEGILQKEEDGEAPEPEGVVVGVPATEGCVKALEQAEVPRLDQGVVAGLSGDLLNEASYDGAPLSVLFTRIGVAELPDHRAAAHLLQVLDRLIPGLAVDPAPLVKQAEVLEKALKASMKMHPTPGPKEPEPSAPEPSIYG